MSKPHLASRQEKIWQKRMIEIEKAMLRYFRQTGRGKEEPDGSFCMNAFKDGFYLGRKKKPKESH